MFTSGDQSTDQTSPCSTTRVVGADTEHHVERPWVPPLDEHGLPVHVGCSSCIYAAALGPLNRKMLLVVPKATREVPTPNGLRQVCDAHARDFALAKLATCGPVPSTDASGPVRRRVEGG